MAELSTESLPLTPSDWDYKSKYNNTGCPEYDASEVTTTSITGLICLLGLVGNGIVFWFLGFCMKRNPFTVYILNLAVADAGFCLCSVAFLLAHLFCASHMYTSILDLFSVLCVCMYSTSLYLLTAISTERCVSVLYPIWHRCRRPKRLSAIVSALFWALSCLLCCPLAISCQVTTNISCFNSFLIIFIPNVLIFAPVMVLSSLILFITVRRNSQRRPPSRLYAAILLTVLFFLLLTVPQSIMLFLPNLVIITFGEMFHMLACASSSINPFIYFLVGSYGMKQFCGSFKLTLQRAFEDQTDSREDRDPSPSIDPVESVI